MTAHIETLLVLPALIFLCHSAQCAPVWQPNEPSFVFKCPPREKLAACSCLASFNHQQIRCNGVGDLSTVQQMLVDNFNSSEIPLLRINNGLFVELTPSAFFPLTIRRLVISGTKLRSISDDTFLGLNDLGFLILANDALKYVPTLPLQKVPNLETLSLAGNQIESLNESSFEQMTNLRYVFLSDNQISHIDPGTFGTQSKTITLSGNRLESLNTSVSNLSNLEWLFVTRNFLEGITYTELEGLSSLKVLLLSENQITHVDDDAFKDLKTLRDLSLAYNRLERLGKCLHHVPQLRHLNLSHNHLTEVTAEEIGHMVQLHILDLSGNSLTSLGTGLSHMKHLVHLNLSQNALTSLTWNDIKWMKELRELDVSRNRLTIISGQLDLFPSKVFRLNLANNMLSNIDDSLFSFRALIYLDLSNNLLTSLDMRDFATNTKLQKLDISGNPFVCDEVLVETLQELEGNMVKIIGAPYCYMSPTLVEAMETG